jgi:hypothetical protein
MKKDGHVDVASARRMVMAICEDGNSILEGLPADSSADLPTWWTNKLAVCSAYMNAARDYLIYSIDSPEPEKEAEEDETMTITISSEEEPMTITVDDDMLPPSAKMVKEMENATEEGQESEDSI